MPSLCHWKTNCPSTWRWEVIVIITYCVTDDYMGNLIFLNDFDRLLLFDLGNCTWISLLDVLGIEGVVGGGGTREIGNGGWKAGSCRYGACDTSGSGGGGGIEKKTSFPWGIGGGMNGGGGTFSGCKTSSFECSVSFSRFRYFIIQQQARQERKATTTRPTQVTLNIRIRSFLWSFSTHTWYSNETSAVSRSGSMFRNIRHQSWTPFKSAVISHCSPKQ